MILSEALIGLEVSTPTTIIVPTTITCCGGLRSSAPDSTGWENFVSPGKVAVTFKPQYTELGKYPREKWTERLTEIMREVYAPTLRI
jgi:hypothetical protein